MAYIGNVPAEKYTALTQQTFSSPTGTSFTLSQAVTNSVDIDLYIDNVKQNPASYSVSGTSLTTSTISSPSTMYCIFNGRTTETVNPPDDSVGLSQIASGTDGNLITFDASGNPAYVATGNDGQVLTSAGAGQPCLFEAPAAGGAWTLIATAVASNSASLTITGVTSTYDTYVLTYANIVGQTDGQMLGIRYGDGGGIDSGGSDYSINRSITYVNSTVNDYGTTGRNFMDVSKDEGNASGEGCSGHAYLHALTDGTIYPSMDYTTSSMPSNATYKPASYTGSGMLNASMTVTQVQLIFSSGNIVSGRITLYGIAHA